MSAVIEYIHGSTLFFFVFSSSVASGVIKIRSLQYQECTNSISQKEHGRYQQDKTKKKVSWTTFFSRKGRDVWLHPPHL